MDPARMTWAASYANGCGQAHLRSRAHGGECRAVGHGQVKLAQARVLVGQAGEMRGHDVRVLEH